MMNNELRIKNQLPLFSQIEPDKILAALTERLQHNRQKIAQLLEQNSSYTWNSLLQPLEQINDELDKWWQPISHLNSVANSPALRKAYNACVPLLSEYSTEIGQNTALYHAIKTFADSQEYLTLNVAQKASIQHQLRDFRLAGVALNTEDKQQFSNIRQELSQLTTQFEENLLDATQAWRRLVTDVTELTGIPETTLQTAQELAQKNGIEGWLLTLDAPCYLSVMQYAEHRPLRQEIYTAYVTRASDVGPYAERWDNSPLMENILKRRAEIARLLGFNNYAEYSLVRKMAKTPTEIINFLEDLARHSLAIAHQERDDLIAFTHHELKPWDISYYSEKLRQQQYAISQEELRPYFPENQVVQGLFAIVEKLYGLQIIEQTNIDTWHPDVRFFLIYDENKQLRGGFYMDLYARAHKRGGAWMAECRQRYRIDQEHLQWPVAFLICNLSAPTTTNPALFTHDEVMTLFHEFGHTLHHILTQVDYPSVSGINGVAWDAVELPSQYMEYWGWEKLGLDQIARHYQTGAALPDTLFDKMIAAKNFQSGIHMLRQLEFALFDMRIHIENSATSARIQEILTTVRQQVGIFPIPNWHRFPQSFSHIFAGGYAAGYYSYKWAEVLASDAFSKFEEHGIFDAKTGREFLHHILEKGGTQDPMDLFIAFRGRKPTTEALLRHSGLLKPTS